MLMYVTLIEFADLLCLTGIYPFVLAGSFGL